MSEFEIFSICRLELDAKHCIFSPSFDQINLVDPASSHTLVFKIKPCMSKCFVFVTLDCRRLIITVIVSLKLFFRWIPVVILGTIHVPENVYVFVYY